MIHLSYATSLLGCTHARWLARCPCGPPLAIGWPAGPALTRRWPQLLAFGSGQPVFQLGTEELRPWLGGSLRKRLSQAGSSIDYEPTMLSPAQTNRKGITSSRVTAVALRSLHNRGDPLRRGKWLQRQFPWIGLAAQLRPCRP